MKNFVRKYWFPIMISGLVLGGTSLTTAPAAVVPSYILYFYNGLTNTYFTALSVGNGSTLTGVVYSATAGTATNSLQLGGVAAAGYSTTQAVEAARIAAIGTNTPSLATVLGVGRDANGISITNLADAAIPQGAATWFQTTNLVTATSNTLAGVAATKQGTNAVLNRLYLSNGGDLTNVTAISMSSNRASFAAWTPICTTNGQTITISNGVGSRAYAYLQYTISISTNTTAPTGFIVSNSSPAGVSLPPCTVTGMSSGQVVTGFIPLRIAPNSAVTFSNVYSLINTSYLGTVWGELW